MNKAEIVEIIKNLGTSYMNQPEKSVLRNTHMNNLEKNDPVTKKQIKEIVQSYLVSLNDENNISFGISTIDVLRTLTQYAKIHVIKANIVSTNQDQLEAVVVDFINFVGVNQGVDYALYTKDI